MAVSVSRSEQLREASRRFRQRNPDYFSERNGHDPGRQMKRKHGIDLAEKQQLLEAQRGRCYLCGDELTFDQAVIDHDHRCCPKNRSCKHCRRGLAHAECNFVIGNAADDPDKLERIAASLRAIQPAVDQRLAAKRASEPALFGGADMAEDQSRTAGAYSTMQVGQRGRTSGR